MTGTTYKYECSHCLQESESLTKPHDPVECVHCRSLDTVSLVRVVTEGDKGKVIRRLWGRD